MDTQIIVVFCLYVDMLKALHHYEDKQRQMSDAEVMTSGHTIQKLETKLGTV